MASRHIYKYSKLLTLAIKPLLTLTLTTSSTPSPTLYPATLAFGLVLMVTKLVPIWLPLH